jgi:hypothetical protein
MLNTYFFDVELLCFWVGPINLEPNTSHRIWYTMWCCDALSCVTTSLAAPGLTFRSCMQNGGIELCAHPTQLRVTRHRVGCDDTQKRWVWPCDLYFWGLGWIVMQMFMQYVLLVHHQGLKMPSLVSVYNDQVC